MDAMTFFRMSLPVKEVQYLASQGSFTPISGDALRAYR